MVTLNENDVTGCRHQILHVNVLTDKGELMTLAMTFDATAYL